MRLLYGVVGEGMGHATRSSVVLAHLLAAGHDVQIIVSGQAAEYLGRRFPQVQRIEGLKMAFEDNELDLSRTAWELIKGLPKMLEQNFRNFISVGETFNPQAVISDFETFSYLFARQHQLPVVSIDNMQIINRCELGFELEPEDKMDFFKAKTLVKSKLPGCYRYLISTFFYPPLRKKRSSLHPPILRDAILDAEPSEGEHLLVYQTTTTNDRLLEVLAAAGTPCRVYGFNKDERLGSLWFREFSETEFVNDLASCRGVLASGGFSLMGEAVYLKKPMLAVPLGGQFEQVLNAIHLQKLGYGQMSRQLTLDAVSAFLEALPDYAQQLQAYRQDGNQEILAELDLVLDEIEAGKASAMPFH